MAEYEDPLRVSFIGTDVLKRIFCVLKQDQEGCKKALLMVIGYCDNAAGYSGIGQTEDYIYALIELAGYMDDEIEMEVAGYANTILDSYRADQADILEKPPITLDEFKGKLASLQPFNRDFSPAGAASSDTSQAPHHGPAAGTQPP